MSLYYIVKYQAVCYLTKSYFVLDAVYLYKDRKVPVVLYDALLMFLPVLNNPCLPWLRMRSAGTGVKKRNQNLWLWRWRADFIHVDLLRKGKMVSLQCIWEGDRELFNNKTTVIVRMKTTNLLWVDLVVYCGMDCQSGVVGGWPCLGIEVESRLLLCSVIQFIKDGMPFFKNKLQGVRHVSKFIN